MSSGLSRRDKRALSGGSGVIAILLLYLLLRGGDPGPRAEPLPGDTVATVTVDQPATYATPAQPPVVAVPVAIAPVTVAPVVAAPVAVAPNGDASQLRLYGVLSRGAVIGMPDGTQRFVPIGREILPGVTLRGVDLHHAILATAGGEVRLGFDIAAQPQAPVESSTVPR
jgi:hypothetical protein